MKNNKINYTQRFWLIAGLHLFIWTLIPSLTRFCLPMDANEGYGWGQHLQLGYDRNPWMNAWLTHLATWVKSQYPHLATLKPIQFQWHRNTKHLKKPIFILFGLLPPQKHLHTS